MKNACIIAGALVDAKNVGVHKSLRLIIDVPQERAMEVIEKLGWPTMQDPIPVAIARLDPNKTKEVPSKDSEQTSPTPASKSARAPNRYAMRAAMMGSDPQFWNYMIEVHRTLIPGLPTDEKHQRLVAADFIREKCGVQSRADIQSSTSAATTFDLLETDFTLWRDADKFVEMA